MKYRRAVFIVVYAKVNKEIKYLVLKRRLHWKGWEFPKGGIEPSETKNDAVKRELLEETGLLPLEIKKHDFSGRYSYKKKMLDRFGLKGQKFYLYSSEVKMGRVKIDKKEHTGFKWVDFKTAIKMLRWPNQKKSLRIVNEWLKTTVQAWPVRRKIS